MIIRTIIILVMLMAYVGIERVSSAVQEGINREKAAIMAEEKKIRVLEHIIKCESDGRFVVGTKADRGVDVGPCQINTFWHQDRALAMGLDLFDHRQNMQYCYWLYENMGTNPWAASRSCWEDRVKLDEQRDVTEKYRSAKR